MIVLSCPIVLDRVRRALNDPSLNTTSLGFQPPGDHWNRSDGPVLNEHPPGVNTQVYRRGLIHNRLLQKKNNMGESMRGACLVGPSFTPLRADPVNRSVPGSQPFPRERQNSGGSPSELPCCTVPRVSLEGTLTVGRTTWDSSVPY